MNAKTQSLWEKINRYYLTYLVGGAVRDMLLGKEPTDYDFATKARPGQIAEVFEGHKVDYVGAHFGVVLVDGVEFATFREDIGDSVKYADTIYEDLSRRDLTINAMAMTFNGIIADPQNGQSDIHNKRIRFVRDARQRIAEDPVRMLRALRFDGLPGFMLTCEAEIVINNEAYRMRSVAPERIQLELLKVLDGPDPSKFFEMASLTGVLPYIFRHLEKSRNHVGGRHHDETVWEHLMLTGDAVHRKFPMVKLAGYLHDIGKPASFNTEDQSFTGHHRVGEIIARVELQRLKFSNAQVEAVAGLTRCHMHTVLKGSSPKSIRKLIKKLSEYGLTWRDFLRLRIADHKANTSKIPYSISEIKEYVRAFQVEGEVTLTTHGLALSGGEIIKFLNIDPGPEVSQLQKQLLEFVLENGEGVNNKPDLLLKLTDLVGGKYVWAGIK